ncbi:MAG TPA: DEAD/DEAH box helicase [candidate division Zixibacteria bacterium]
MRIDKLIRYGIPDSIIESWKKTQGNELLPLQAAAVVKHDLLNGKSLIISAPTSSGKTFCGEMAAAVNLFKRKKVVFLVPLKAVAEEKYADFCRKYSPLGIRVTVSTRDRLEDDRKIERGDFDLAIMIYEKFNRLLIKNLDVLNSINLVVVDELQMIGDHSRGMTLELVLTKIKSSKYSPQILGLSAVLKDPEQLSSWLGCQLLLEKNRPVELLQGVLLNGEFRFRKHNSGEEGSQKLVGLESEEPHLILFANLNQLLEEKEQVLVFLKSKKNCEDCALLFSEQAHSNQSTEAIRELSELENTTLREKLVKCLEKGVAFHNADLTFDERRVIEHFYLKGDIRIIFSTTTLSLGINLPAKTVFIETQKYEVGEYSGKAVMSPLSWSEYENMSGRAGRFGLENQFGRSVIIAQNQFQFDTLWEGYIEGEEEKITSRLSPENLADVILDLVASGAGKTQDKLKSVLTHSLGGGLILENQDIVREKTEELLQINVLSKNEEVLSPTRIGSLCAFKGITVKTGLALKRKLENPADYDLFSWFYSVLNTPDGEEIYISVNFLEEQNRVYEKALIERYEDKPAYSEGIATLLTRTTGFSPAETKRLKMAFVLSEWITSRSTIDLENKYLCRSGQIEQIGKQTSWLLDAAGGMAKVLNKDRSISFFLKRLSLKVNFGTDDLGIKFARLRVPGLGRDYIWALVRKGYCSLKSIRETKIEDLAKIIPATTAQKLKEKVEEKSESANRKNQKNKEKKRLRQKTDVSIKDNVSLVIDGTPVKDKFLVLVNGKKVVLPAKSFKYLVKLTWAAFRNEDGWIHKNDFEPGENQTRYLHRLKKQIEPYLERGMFLLENNRLGSYRLNVSKDKIKINAPTLLKNPDIEIKKIAEELA